MTAKRRFSLFHFLYQELVKNFETRRRTELQLALTLIARDGFIMVLCFIFLNKIFGLSKKLAGQAKSNPIKSNLLNYWIIPTRDRNILTDIKAASSYTGHSSSWNIICHSTKTRNVKYQNREKHIKQREQHINDEFRSGLTVWGSKRSYRLEFLEFTKFWAACKFSSSKTCMCTETSDWSAESNNGNVCVGKREVCDLFHLPASGEVVWRCCRIYQLLTFPPDTMEAVVYSASTILSWQAYGPFRGS